MEKPVWTKEIKVLVWDLDNTLYKEIHIWDLLRKRIAYQELAHFGWLSIKKFFDILVSHKLNLSQDFKKITSFNLYSLKIKAKIVNNVQWEQFVKKDKKITNMFLQLKKYKHLLLSTNTRQSALVKLHLLGLDPRVFEEMFLGIDMQMTKPDRRLFQHILDYTHLPARKHMMIGDSIDKDIMPASQIGMRTCVVWKKNSQADVSLKKVYDVVELLK